ncbi:phosphoglucosamine mutase [Candidatus Saganbacteria bacterium]|nr:phosphoglucosamine mutase [Candidatus Saganbacteria bacterium]
MLKISISGVRGTVPDSLTSEICIDLSKAFGTYLKGGSVVIGADTRTSSGSIKKIVISGLVSCGCKVIDLSIATTPTVGIMVRKLKADGGIIITASHNPEPWNGIKFVRSDGIFLNSAQASELLDIYYAKKFKERSGGRSKAYTKADDDHIKLVLKNVNTAKIRRRKFKVAIDSVNGAGSIITPIMLKKLGCEVIAINVRPASPFPRGPEPTPANIKELSDIVKQKGADIGFAQDPDADRLAIVAETGEAISEEYTLGLCAKFILKRSKKKIVVTNLSTTQAIDDIAKKFGAKIIRTKIGEVYVAEKIKSTKAPIGGEGNGGIIFPKVGFNRDSLSGIAILLNLLAEEKRPLSKIVDDIPKYYLVKNKMGCKSSKEAQDFLDKIKDKFQKDTLDLTEGIKVLRDYGWLHLRPSNTEPIIRIFAEAKSKDEAEAFIREALG